MVVVFLEQTTVIFPRSGGKENKSYRDIRNIDRKKYEIAVAHILLQSVTNDVFLSEKGSKYIY